MVSTYNQAPDLSASTCQSGKDGTKRSGLRSTDGSPGAALAVFSPASLFCVRGTFLSTQTQTRRVKYMVCSCEMLECWVAGRTCIAMGRRRKVRQCRAKPEPAWQSGSAKCHATPRSGLIHAIPKAGRDSLCFSAAVRSDNGTMSSRPSRCLFGWPAVCLCSSTLHANEPRPPPHCCLHHYHQQAGTRSAVINDSAFADRSCVLCSLRRAIHRLNPGGSRNCPG